MAPTEQVAMPAQHGVWPDEQMQSAQGLAGSGDRSAVRKVQTAAVNLTLRSPSWPSRTVI
jgi:hypothetical protein